MISRPYKSNKAILLLIALSFAAIQTVLGQTIVDKNLYFGGTPNTLTRTSPTGTTSSSSITYDSYDEYTITLQPIEDTHISTKSGAQNRNYGQCTYLWSGQYDRTLLQFDFSSIPAGATITAADLNLYHYASTGTSTLDVHEITTAWTEGIECASNNTPNWRNPWNNQGGDYNATIYNSQVLSSATLNSYVTWNVLTLVNSWYFGATNYGLMLRTDDVAWNDFRSTENSTNQPYLEITYRIPNPTVETYSLTPSLCDDFTIDSSQPIEVLTHVTVDQGTLPANPNVTATLEYNGNFITSISNPSYNSGNSTITWTSTLGSDITIPAGESIDLILESNETAAEFRILYNSITHPTNVSLPTSTYINVESFNAYDAAYPGGNIITETFSSELVYYRVTVSDPFGTYDITNLELDITNPTGATSTVTATEVATSGCNKIYEYTWSAGNTDGVYNIEAIAYEGSEGITDVQSLNFLVSNPIEVTKTIVSPATGPYTLDDIIVYNLQLYNPTNKNRNGIPLFDIYNPSCLEYQSATVSPTTISNGSLQWTGIGPISPGGSYNINVTFKVIDNCDPALNVGRIEGNGYPVRSDTVSINIDEPPIANDDNYFLAGSSLLDVLSNDSDPDNDITSLTIVAPPSQGSATVVGNDIQFNTGGMSDNSTTSFTYQICDNATPSPYCETAVVTIVFSNFNDAPSLQNDVATTTVNLPVTIDVLTNDSDIDGTIDPSTLSISSSPSNGLISINADGTIKYTPNFGFTGVDQFEYQVCDTGMPLPSKCSTARVDVIIDYVIYACPSGTALLSVDAVPGATGYNWILPSGAFIVSGINTNSVEVDFSALTPGTYNICVEPTNDCGPGTDQCVDVVILDMQLTLNPNDISCYNELTGAIDLEVSSGIPPYSYSWSNGASVQDISNLGPGSYTVTVTDYNGCVASATASITQPSSSVQITSGIVTDEDPYGAMNGEINLSVAGGTSPYSYLWTDGTGNTISTVQDPASLSAGTYTVLVTDLNGCTATATYTVNAVGGPFLITALIGTDILCYGQSTGSINLEVTGGSGVYTYDWNYDGVGDFNDPQDLNNLTAGNYYVTISDGVNPNLTANITLTGPSSSLGLSRIGTDPSCNGEADGSIDLTVTGGTPPYSYNWSNGSNQEDISDLGPDYYSVTVTDANGCDAITGISLFEPPAMVVNGNALASSCDDPNSGEIDLTVSGGTSPYNYNWSNGATTRDISNLSPGNYTVTVTDFNGCQEVGQFQIASNCLGISKRVGTVPVNNGDGSYTFTYEIKAVNLGTTDLSNVQITDDLATTFNDAVSYTIESINIIAQPLDNWTINNNFDGDSDDELLANPENLYAGDQAIISIEITLVPGQTTIYYNSAFGDGDSPNGISVSDQSQDGVNPDPDGDGDPTNNSDPTPIEFYENPVLGLAKDSTYVQSNSDGSYEVRYRLRIENMGDIVLNDIQITDNLESTFSGLSISNVTTSIITQPLSSTLVLNSNYDGLSGGDLNVLNGTGSLNVGEYSIIEISLDVVPLGSLGPYYNSATASGESPTLSTVTDISQDGTNPDPDNDDDPTNNSDPTPIRFYENPGISLVKDLTSQQNNSDGTFQVVYTLQINNNGDVALHNLSLTDDLNLSFPGLNISSVSSSIVTQPVSTIINLNGSYTGTTTGDIEIIGSNSSLLPGEFTIIQLTLNVQPDGSSGPFTNTAFVTGTSPFNTDVTSTDSTDVNFNGLGIIGLAKSAGTPVNNNDGSYTVDLNFTIENVGDLSVSDIQITDNLNNTFPGLAYFVHNLSSPDFLVNSSFNGDSDTNLLAGTDNLDIGEVGYIYFSVTVTPGTDLGTHYNSAVLTGTDALGNTINDTSQNGNNVDPDNDGDPGNNSTPTPILFTENPIIGVSKVIPTTPFDNADNTCSLTYRIRLENYGDVPLSNIQLVDPLNITFLQSDTFYVENYSIVTMPSSTILTLNPNFDGKADINLLDGSGNLLVGEYAIFEIQVRVEPISFLGPYDNTAIGTGLSTGGSYVIDNSQDGYDPDPDGDGNPKNNNVPTSITFPEKVCKIIFTNGFLNQVR